MDDFLQSLKNTLFIDIETISGTQHFSELNERMQAQWRRKANFIDNKTLLSEEEMYFERAGIYAEFGKIIAIGIGFIHENEEKELSLKVKCFAGDDEKNVLEDFKLLLEKKFNAKKLVLCAHNGKEFDFPYICRRMLVNQIKLPETLQLSNKKPWEIIHKDTLEMWKFGDKKHYISLELLASLFNIQSSKQILSGDKVNETYYRENNLALIEEYCIEDIIVLAQLYLKFNFHETIAENNIIKT